MKTISSFLLGVLFIITSILFLSFAIKAIDNSNQLYITTTNSEPQDFEVTFLFTAVMLLILTGLSIVLSVTSFKVFYSYYLEAIKRKRDNDILNNLKDSKYDKLYADLNATNIYEQKAQIVKQFYNKDGFNTYKALVDMLAKFKVDEPASVFNRRAAEAVRNNETNNKPIDFGKFFDKETGNSTITDN